MLHADIAVLTVIPAELEAARRALGIAAQQPSRADGAGELHATLRSELTGRTYRVVLACIGAAGNAGAAAFAAGMLARHAPRALVLMGIAAGVRGKVRIGDVVLSDRVVAYEPAALVRDHHGASVQPRPEIDRAPFRIVQDLTHYHPDRRRLDEAFARAGGAFPTAPAGEEDTFREHVARSVAAHAGTIASGEKLLRDPEKLHGLRDSMHGKIEAGEMEAAGVAEACRQREVPWLVIRGISDFGDALKNDALHGFAACAAAAVLVDFLACGLHLPGEPDDEPIYRGVPMGREHSPFIYGRPIDHDGDFFGREDQKRRILDALHNGQPVQLLGEKLTGKTSLLKWAQRHVLLDRPAVWVDPTRGLTPVSMVQAIARALRKPKVAAQLDTPQASWRRAAAALDALVPFVLLMDDADALAELGEGFHDGFFGTVRAHVQHRNLTWLSASRRNLYEVFKSKDLWSEFLNDAVKVWVGPLEPEAARALARRAAPADEEALLAMSGRLAFGLQWLGDYLRRRPGALDAAYDAFAREMEPTFERWWRGLDVAKQALVKQCKRPGLELGKLPERAIRGMLRMFVERGLLAERDGWFVVEGEAWAEFVEHAPC